MEILKPKKKILKNENAVNRKLGNLKNIGYLGNIIPSFVNFVFQLCPVAKIDESNLKKLKKNFRSFQVFDLAYIYIFNQIRAHSGLFTGQF